MRVPGRISLIVLLAHLAMTCLSAQSLGALEVQVKAVKINGKAVPINRKRFYLFRGGSDTTANKALIDKLSADMTSRDCFYCKMKASPEYIAWLKDEKAGGAGGCESPFCRQITDLDIQNVPEFQAAFKIGKDKFSGRDDLAKKWLTTNLPPDLRDGFYRQQKSFLDSLWVGNKPIQTAMTDPKGFRAIFVDIPLKTPAKEVFMLSNLLPIEFDGKGYIWVCDVEITGENIAMNSVKLSLLYPEVKAAGKKCRVITKDFPKCDSGSCAPR